METGGRPDRALQREPKGTEGKTVSYLERLRNRQPQSVGTDKTNESPTPSGKRGLDGTDKTDKSPLLAVLSVRQGAHSQFEDPSPVPAERPHRALYERWLGGIQERCAFLTLDEPEVHLALEAGMVDAATAEASVLLAYRSPRGVCGICAIPREKYDAFQVIEIMGANRWVH